MIEVIEKIILDDLISDEIKIKSGHSYLFNSKPVPSVTTIISKCINEDYIISWANYLGFKRQKYKDVLNNAAKYGTESHNSIERFLKSGEKNTNIALQSFILWWNIVNHDHKVDIIGIEESMVVPYCGGTYDLLINIDGKVYLVDLKTSNNLHYKYFVQLAGYRHMLYKSKNINIDGCIILQLDKNEPAFNEQLLDFSIDSHYQFIEQCAFTFISMVLNYYNIYKTEKMWKSIFE